jgi:hypothetical protein
MTKERKLYIYQNVVTVVGLTLWGMALAQVVWAYSLREQIIILALVRR